MIRIEYKEIVDISQSCVYVDFVLVLPLACRSPSIGVGFDSDSMLRYNGLCRLFPILLICGIPASVG